MGRGRAKAKQTKVARQLKYNSGGTDLSRLAEELGASPSRPVNPEPVEDDDDENEDDPYAQYADLYNDDDDEEDEDESQQSSPQRRRA
jgi:phage terminase small subunit